ncbi:MAG: hypothetical protein NTW46_03620, partial [Candidatus Nealsonbacteria bacterium]|nr:hypothetical protein [Candidatus Nealsonbacteria bacterium]
AKRSGLSGSALLRNDPRLARLNTMIEEPLTDPVAIANRDNGIVQFAGSKGIKGTGKGTGINNFSAQQIEDMKQEMAVRDTVKDLKPSNITNFEKETLEDEEMMTYMLGHGTDHFATMGSGVKRGVETGQKTINNIYKKWAQQNGYSNAKAANTAANRAQFEAYVSKLTGGRTGFFDSLRNKEPRLISQGWTEPTFMP